MIITVEIFTGPDCASCAQVKAILDEVHAPYSEYDISRPDNLSELIRRLPGNRAIPQIFVDGVHIGGLEELQLIRERGRRGAESLSG